MIERIKRLILEKKVDVKSLLVVTFVNSAASDIKEKLRNTIIAEYEKSKDEFLYEALNDLPLSNISTLHSFCNDLVKTYFYKLNILPKYNIAEEEELSVLKNKAIVNVLDNYYEEEDKDFIELIEIFADNRNDTIFKEGIFKMYEFLSSKVDGKEYLKEVVLKSYSDENKIKEILDLFNKTLCSDIVDFVSVLDYYKAEFEKYQMDAFVEHVMGMQITLNRVNTSKSINENLQVLKAIEFDSVPTKRNAELSTDMFDLKESYKEFKSSIKTKLDKQVKKYKFSDDEDFALLIKNNYKYIKLISEILIKFDEEFSNLKRQSNVLDFADLERFTIKLLKDESIREELQKKYEYVFVDEYQDINPVQEFILKSISNGKNMFMVGDVKQSIYAFRLCSPEIFLNKYDLYKKDVSQGYAIDLNENFRSEENILEFNNAIFSSIMTKELGGVDYKGTSKLKKGRDIKKLNTLPTTTILNVEEEKKEKQEITKVYSLKDDITHKKENKVHLEAKAIESYILKLVGREKIFDDNNENGRFIEYGDIVILVRDMKEKSTNLYRYLSESGLPVIAEIQEDTGQEVLTLIDTLKIIDNIKQDIPLASVMRSCIGGFSDEELAEVRIYSNKQKKGKISFLDAIEFYTAEKEDKLSQKLKAFLDKISTYNAMLSFMSVNEILSKVVTESGFDIYVSSLKNGSARLSKVNNFIINVSRSVKKDNLAEFLNSIKDEEDKLKNGGNSTITQNAIRFMTIHKSKGLEFPVVIFADANKNIDKSGIGASPKFNISDTLGIGLESYDFVSKVRRPSPIYEAIKYQKQIEGIFEEIRILYVCLTRAKNHLLITSLNAKPPKFTPKEFNISYAKTYLQLIMTGINKLTFDELKKTSINIINLSESEIIRNDVDLEKKVEFVKADKDKAVELIEKISKPYEFEKSTSTTEKYTVTEINNINKEIVEEVNKPKKILNSEDAINEGILYHTIFQNIDLNSKTKADVKNELERMREKEIITDDEFLSIEIDKIFNALQSEFIMKIKDYKIYREIPFMLREKGSKYDLGTDDFVIIQGQIDLLAVSDDKAIVVDFKNSRLTDADRLRETYKNQLMVYADAVKNIFADKEIERYIFSLKESNAIKV